VGAVRVVQHAVVVPAGPAVVWERVVTPEGVNHEMRPWMTMSMPCPGSQSCWRGWSVPSSAIATAACGRPSQAAEPAARGG